MPMIYYYLVASLPTIHLDEKLSVSSEEFLKICESWLSPDDLLQIKYLIADQFDLADHPSIRKWLDGETQLRNAIARWRASKMRIEAGPFLRPCSSLDLRTEKVVADAMGKPNPLECQLALDRHRLSLLDELALFEPFGMPAIIAYALKLKIAQRWSRLNAAEGNNVLNNLITKHVAGVAV